MKNRIIFCLTISLIVIAGCFGYTCYQLDKELDYNEQMYQIAREQQETILKQNSLLNQAAETIKNQGQIQQLLEDIIEGKITMELETITPETY